MRNGTSTAVLLTTVATASAQQTADRTGVFSSPQKYASAKITRAERNYLGCLSQGNDGAVESAIAQLVMLRLMQPTREMAAVAEKLNFIAIHAPSATTRYKASLAAIVFDHPELFAGEREAEYIVADHLFTALAGRLNHVLLGSTVQ